MVPDDTEMVMHIVLSNTQVSDDWYWFPTNNSIFLLELTINCLLIKKKTLKLVLENS